MEVEVLSINGVAFAEEALRYYRDRALKNNSNPDWFLRQLVAALRDHGGVTALELRRARYTAQELWNGGYSYVEIRAAKYLEEIDTSLLQTREPEEALDLIVEALRLKC